MINFVTLMLLSLFACSDGKGVATLVGTEPDTAEIVDPITWNECGHETGQHPCNFTFLNQHGEEVSLYDYHGKPVLIDMSTMWCSYCAVAAIELTAVKREYENIGLETLILLFENGNREQPHQEDLEYWADMAGTQDNVLSTSTDILNADKDLGWNLAGWPTFYVVDEYMVVRGSLTGFHPEMIRDLVEDSLGAHGAPHGDVN